MPFGQWAALPRYDIKAMWWFKKYDAFISYSHKDSAVVKPLVELLSLNQRRVFWDEQLAPGDRWEDVIQSSVKDSSVFVLFWCCDTRASDYIGKEIALAIRLKKKIVPVKLCDAAMPASLGEWQWIDLQKRVTHQCVPLEHQVPVPPQALAPAVAAQERAPVPAAAFPRLALLAVLGIILLAIGISVQFREARQIALPTPITARPSEKGGKVTAGAGTALLRDGYAVISPPQGGEDGSITEFNRGGNMVGRLPIPAPVHESPVNIRDVEIPWWYPNRIALLVGMFFAAVLGLLIFLILRHRKRTAKTVILARNYLERLADSF